MLREEMVREEMLGRGVLGGEMVRESPGFFRVKVFLFGGLLRREMFVWLVGRGCGGRCSSGV